MTSVAKIFMNGASQAVRLPKEFRFEANEVIIKRIGSAVLLFPKNAAWDLMGEALGKVENDFLTDRAQPRRIEKRKAIDSKKRKFA
jgi:antitoxin VapB